MDNLNENIFIKKPRKNVSLKLILKSLPETHYDEQQHFPNKTEWRLRILEINNKKYFELCYLYNGTRIFINNKSQWVNYNIGNEYDDKVIKIMYWYC